MQNNSYKIWKISLKILTKILLTRQTSKIVGTTLNTSADKTKLMPLFKYYNKLGKYLIISNSNEYRVPLSMAFERAPVWRFKWKLKSILCKWMKTLPATRRMESCATFANTAFLNSLKSEELALAMPSKINAILLKLNDYYLNASLIKFQFRQNELSLSRVNKLLKYTLKLLNLYQ